MNTLIVAYALLMMPDGTPFTYEHMAYTHIIAAYCEDEQILNSKTEIFYNCWVLETLRTHMDYVRRRYDELHDAPRAEDMARFKYDKYETWEAWQFNQRFEKYLTDVETYYPYKDELIYEIKIENHKLARIWLCLNNMNQGYIGNIEKRRYLAELKELLGDEAYYNTIIPPPVPYQCFTRIE